MQILNDFLHKEYGGPGTLLVEPFTDMLLALKEKKLPGAAVAARAALLWAQNYVDQDWEIWTSQQPKWSVVNSLPFIQNVQTRSATDGIMTLFWKLKSILSSIISYHISARTLISFHLDMLEL